jgi:hypothetical protein
MDMTNAHDRRFAMSATRSKRALARGLLLRLTRRLLVALSTGVAVLGIVQLSTATPASAANCGAPNQRPCKVWERIPSCNKGLVENFRLGRCVQPARIVCGALNQRPCKVTERIPSCDPQLKEDFSRNRCVRLKPGESPFFGGLASLVGEIAKASELCKTVLGSVPSISVGNGPVNVAFNCRRGYEIGYRCAAPQLLKLVAENAQLAGRIDAALNTPACRQTPQPLKTLCALGKVVDDFAIRPALCMSAIAARGGFTQLADGDSKTIEYMCTAAGETAFEIAVDKALRARSRGRDNAARFFRKLRKIKKVAEKGAHLERVMQQLQNEPACSGILN